MGTFKNIVTMYIASDYYNIIIITRIVIDGMVFFHEETRS